MLKLKFFLLKNWTLFYRLDSAREVFFSSNLLSSHACPTRTCLMKQVYKELLYEHSPAHWQPHSLPEALRGYLRHRNNSYDVGPGTGKLHKTSEQEAGDRKQQNYPAGRDGVGLRRGESERWGQVKWSEGDAEKYAQADK